MADPTGPGPESSPFPRRRQWLAGLALAVLTLLVFLPLFHAGFVWDDDSLLLQNPLMLDPGGWHKAWTSLVAYDYVPATITTFWLEWRLWGAHPLGYHVDNILLHLAAALVLWRILLRLRVPGAWLAAALFAVHPVNVESVAWVTQRKNTLAMVFFLLSIKFYLTFEDSDRRRWFWLSAGLYLLALLGKTAVAPLPLVLLGLAWWRRGRIVHVDWWHSAVFGILAVGGSLLAIWIQRGAAFNVPVRVDSFWVRLAGAGWALWFYLGKVLWPLNLGFVYPRWEIPSDNPLSYLPLVLWVAGLAGAWACRRRTLGKAILLALGYFSILLLPVLGFCNIVFMLYSLVSDHWQYFAIIGPLALIAAGIKTGLARLTQQQWPGCAIGAALLTVLGVLTWNQCRLYANAETLWRATLERNPRCWLALNDLGAICYERGQTEEAINLYHRSIAVEPGNAEAHNNLAAALEKSGRNAEATAEYKRALELRPYFAEAHRNFGELLLREGRVDEAIAHFREAVNLRPDIAKSHRSLASALIRSGHTDEAVAEYNEALTIHPDDVPTRYDLGVLLLQLGRDKEAVAEFENVLSLRPDHADAENNLGYGLLHLGSPPDAITHFQKALALRPNFGQALYNLGNAELQQGRPEEAIIPAQKLVGLQPNLAPPHQLLGEILLRLSRKQEAILEFDEAESITKTVEGVAKKAPPP